jgi:hypothetical protein
LIRRLRFHTPFSFSLFQDFSRRFRRYFSSLIAFSRMPPDAIAAISPLRFRFHAIAAMRCRCHILLMITADAIIIAAFIEATFRHFISPYFHAFEFSLRL